MIIAVNFQFKQLERRSQEKKYQGFNGIRTRDLRVAGALLYQLSYEATHWERVHISREEWNDVNYIWKLTSLPMCGFIAQLVEQRTGNEEVTGSNPVEALIFFFFFFQASSFQLLKLEIYCDDHSSLNKYKSIKPRTGLYDSDEYKSNFCIYLSL